MTLKKVILRHTIIAASLGTLFVASVLPIYHLAFLAWLVVLLSIVLVGKGLDERGTTAALVTEIVVMACVVALAAWAPVKIIDRQLDQVVELPRTELTLAELHADTSPLRRAFDFLYDEPAPVGQQTVHFPSQRLPLHEIIAAVESQTNLRHHFICCGNGWTILWGEYCGPVEFSPTLDTPR